MNGSPASWPSKALKKAENPPWTARPLSPHRYREGFLIFPEGHISVFVPLGLEQAVESFGLASRQVAHALSRTAVGAARANSSPCCSSMVIMARRVVVFRSVRRSKSEFPWKEPKQWPVSDARHRKFRWPFRLPKSDFQGRSRGGRVAQHGVYPPGTIAFGLENS